MKIIFSLCTIAAADARCRTRANFKPSDWLDKVVVARTTVAALYLQRELGEAQRDLGGIQQLFLALVALHTSCTARKAGKQIVRVHGAYLVVVAIPDSGAEATSDPVFADEAFEADGREVHRVVTFALYFKGRVIGLKGREVESAIDERKLIIDGEFCTTEDTIDEARAMKGQTAENKGASIITSTIAIIFHLDVVRVDQVPRE